MIKTKKSERRQHPRLEHRLPLKIAANGYDFATSTLNISCLGAYCFINKYVPPFTRVMVKLTLPILTEDGNKECNVECRGVIVRTEDEDKGGFKVAIFFNQIKDLQCQRISQYINQFLPKESPTQKIP